MKRFHLNLAWNLLYLLSALEIARTLKCLQHKHANLSLMPSPKHLGMMACHLPQCWGSGQEDL